MTRRQALSIGAWICGPRGNGVTYQVHGRGDNCSVTLMPACGSPAAAQPAVNISGSVSIKYEAGIDWDGSDADAYYFVADTHAARFEAMAEQHEDEDD